MACWPTQQPAQSRGLGRSTAAPGFTSTWATRLHWRAQTRRVVPCAAVVGCKKRPTPRDCAGCRACQQAGRQPLSSVSPLTLGAAPRRERQRSPRARPPRRTDNCAAGQTGPCLSPVLFAGELAQALEGARGAVDRPGSRGLAVFTARRSSLGLTERLLADPAARAVPRARPVNRCSGIHKHLGNSPALARSDTPRGALRSGCRLRETADPKGLRGLPGRPASRTPAAVIGFSADPRCCAAP